MELWKLFIKYCPRPGMIKIRTFNPHIGRAGLLRSAKAGVVSGVISGVVFAPLFLLVQWVFGWLIHPQSNELAMYWSFERMVAEHFLSPYFVTFLIPSIIVLMILGLFFGLLFIVLYDKLPGKTSTMKGIVTGIIYGAAFYLGLPLIVYLITGLPENTGALGADVIMVGLGTSILWGWLLGRFWAGERFGKL
jgi:hypothetical protein